MKLLKNQQYVTVLDIGSGKITVMVGKQTKDGFLIVAQSETRYGGYYDGVWLEPEKLQQEITNVVRRAENSLGKKIKEIYVGVPGAFTAVAASQATVTCRFKKKFDKNDLAEIYAKANLYKDDVAYKPINRAPLYYVINDNKKTNMPVGMDGTKLTGYISYIYADVRFLNKIETILKNIGVIKVEFVSSCHAESWFLLDQKVRDNTALLIDVGYISTSVMLICGDGISYMRTFSIGGGHICADLSEILGISYQMAEDLYGKVNLNLEFDPEEVYQLKNSQTANADQTNQIVKARIEDLARYIRKSMAGCPNTVNTKMPVFLTGGGLSNVKGGVEYLSTVLDKPVSIAHSVNPLTDKPQYASAFGVIDLVLNQNN